MFGSIEEAKKRATEGKLAQKRRAKLEEKIQATDLTIFEKYYSQDPRKRGLIPLAEEVGG